MPGERDIACDIGIAMSGRRGRWKKRDGPSARTRSASALIPPFVSVGEQLPVGLHHSEQERRADAEQQHTVHRFERAEHPPPGWQRQSRYFERSHGGQGIDGRVRERVERTEPPIWQRPQHALQPVQSGQYQCDGSDVADHGWNRPPQIRLVLVDPDPNPVFQAERHQHHGGRVDRDGQHDERKAQAPTRKIHLSSLPPARSAHGHNYRSGLPVQPPRDMIRPGT